MSEQITAKTFLELLKKSQVVSEEKLKPSLKRLSAAANGRAVSVDELGQHLIQEGLITEWHQQQLLSGKHKGFFLGQYRLLRLLGSGGMSAVYLAQHAITGHLRAIKVLPKSRLADKSYLDRFYLEGRAAATLKHPNIAQIVDLANDGDVHYMVMEYVEGIDLDRLVRDQGGLGIERALNLLSQIAQALKHAHARNIVHRDIKPANVMIANDGGSVKLLDLGLALLRDQDQSLTVMHNERVMGTADYLAPEQAIDSHTVDHRADIYSLGCTLYYMLTGHAPFPDGTIAQRIARHQTVDPKPISETRSDCPLSVERLCQRMMKKKPDERFLDCQELLDAVQKVTTLMSIDNKAKTTVIADPKTTGASKSQAQSPLNLGAVNPIAQAKQSVSPSTPVIAGSTTANQERHSQGLAPLANGSTSSNAPLSNAPAINSRTEDSPNLKGQVAATPGSVAGGVKAAGNPPASPQRQSLTPKKVPATSPGTTPKSGPAKTTNSAGPQSASPQGIRPQTIGPPAAGVQATTPQRTGGGIIVPDAPERSATLGDLSKISLADTGRPRDLSGLNLAEGPRPAVAGTLARKRKKGGKGVWLIGGLILLMFAILLIVLYFLNKSVAA